MPRYWLITTWPVDFADEPYTRHVFLRASQKPPSVGDVVFFRENQSLRNRTPKRMTDGAIIRLSPGTGGLFCKAVVADEPIPLPMTAPFPVWLKTYDFGNLKSFERVSRCHLHKFRRHCNMQELAGILGVKKIGLAENHREIVDPVMIDQLLKCF